MIRQAHHDKHGDRSRIENITDELSMIFVLCLSSLHITYFCFVILYPADVLYNLRFTVDLPRGCLFLKISKGCDFCHSGNHSDSVALLSLRMKSQDLQRSLIILRSY